MKIEQLAEELTASVIDDKYLGCKAIQDALESQFEKGVNAQKSAQREDRLNDVFGGILTVSTFVGIALLIGFLVHLKNSYWTDANNRVKANIASCGKGEYGSCLRAINEAGSDYNAAKMYALTYFEATGKPLPGHSDKISVPIKEVKYINGNPVITLPDHIIEIRKNSNGD